MLMGLIYVQLNLKLFVLYEQQLIWETNYYEIINNIL
jgi:hypothetical protein